MLASRADSGEIGIVLPRCETNVRLLSCGYALKSRVRYKDHDETLKAGDAYYLVPGHTTVFEEGTELGAFSPRGEYQKTLEVAARNMAAMQLQQDH
jgi:hypothetical protein